MMLTNYQFVFKADGRVKGESCYKCETPLEEQKLVFSRRHKKRYCIACATSQGFL